mmetsp:Transcript_20071/g.47180  ORF Transcript_20071/g.47180 Transcript_20071/m.47180 type:complete len:559 (-) Transcript_20071:18-1694(-)
MLRSRGNRQQRPGEQSDSGGSYGGSYSGSYSGYGGYGGMGVASGADDYNRSGSGSSTASGRSSTGGGYGGGGVGMSSAYGRNSKPLSRQPPPSTGGGFLIMFAFFSIMILCLGGATYHYQRAIVRVDHEMMVIESRLASQRRRLNNRPPPVEDKDEPEEETEDEQDDEPDAGSPPDEDTMKIIRDLEVKKKDLQRSIGQWASRVAKLEKDVKSNQREVEKLEKGDLSDYTAQIEKLRSDIDAEVAKASAYKEEFVSAHKPVEQGGIIPGGPGQAIVVKREIEKMESLDEYEEYVQMREDALWDKIDALVESMSAESRREALEWFGPGPHHVQLEIEYPRWSEDGPSEPDDWPRVRGVLEIELAPIQAMPIAVNLFLQQVHHKLWDGCVFVINAMHILQAGPHRFAPDNDGYYDANIPELMDRFVDGKLDKMPFQEYSKDFPHEQYTLGFAGRPGGPDFYVNKIDNSVNHGPGGQGHHDLHEEADPSFGRIVRGVEIIQELNRIPTDGARGHLLKYPVVIVEARVMAGPRGRGPPPEAEGEGVKDPPVPETNGRFASPT